MKINNDSSGAGTKKTQLSGSFEHKYTSWGIFKQKTIREEYQQAVQQAAKEIIRNLGETKNISIKDLSQKFALGHFRAKDLYKAIDIELRCEANIDKYTSRVAKFFGHVNPFYQETVDYYAKKIIKEEAKNPNDPQGLMQFTVISCKNKFLDIQDLQKRIDDILASPQERQKVLGCDPEKSSDEIVSSDREKSLDQIDINEDFNLVQVINRCNYTEKEWKDFYKGASADKLAQFMQSYVNINEQIREKCKGFLELVDLNNFSSSELDVIFSRQRLDLLPDFENLLTNELVETLSPQARNNIYLHAAENEKIDILRKLDIDCPDTNRGDKSIKFFCRKSKTIEYIVDRYEMLLNQDLEKDQYSPKTIERIRELFEAWEILRDFRGQMSTEQTKSLEKINNLLGKLDIKKLNLDSEPLASVRKNIFFYGAYMERLDFLQKSLEGTSLKEIMGADDTKSWIRDLGSKGKNESLRYLMTHDIEYFSKPGSNSTLNPIQILRNLELSIKRNL